MRRWMLDAPRWVLALVMGVPFGLWMGLFTRFFQDGSWTQALVTGGFAGVFFGAVMSVVVHRQNRVTRAVVGELSESQIKRAARATWRGPVPEDAATREAAHGLLTSQLTRLRRQRIWAVPFLVLMVGLGVYLGLTESAWWWLTVALWTVLALGHLYWPDRLQRRADLLRGTPTTEPTGWFRPGE